VSTMQLTQHELKEAIQYLSCYFESIQHLDYDHTLWNLIIKMKKILELDIK